MAYPITDKGTTTNYVGGSVTGSVRIERKTSKQAKPYNLPADYRDARRFVQGTGTLSSWTASTGVSPWYALVPNKLSAADSLVASSLNTSRERCISKMRERAGFGIDLAQSRQAITMIAGRLGQIYRFSRDLRKGNLKKAVDHLKMNRKHKEAFLRSSTKSFSKNFLEAHFGWAPLIADIHDGLAVLTNPVKDKIVHGSNHAAPVTLRGSYISDSQWKDVGVQQFAVRTRVSAGIRVTNPNLGLLAQLGLTNPLSVAWDAIPFSFVADWFINVSQVLNQMDELYGLELVEPFYTFGVTATGRYESYLAHYIGSVFQGSYLLVGTASSSLNQFERIRGFPNVTLGFRSGVILSPLRAITACTLLVQKGLR